MNGTGRSRRISDAEKKLHPENAAAFGRMDLPDQEAFLSLANDFHLSLQTEREFLEWLPEIAYFHRQSVKAVLQSEEILAARKSTVLNAPQKIQKIREYIFSSRFPRYDATLKKWKHLVQQAFGSTSNITITPNPYFEKKRMELRITVSGADEACAIMKKLAAITYVTWASLIDPASSSTRQS